MNVIVGILLVAMNRNEENAFWLLSALVEDTLYPGTYSRNLQGCQVGGGWVRSGCVGGWRGKKDV